MQTGILTTNTLKLKNTIKAAGPDFILLKFTNFQIYSVEPKTALVRTIFNKNERNKPVKKL